MALHAYNSGEDFATVWPQAPVRHLHRVLNEIKQVGIQFSPTKTFFFLNPLLYIKPRKTRRKYLPCVSSVLVHQTTLDPSPCPSHRRQEGCGPPLRQVETAQDCCFHGHNSSNHHQTFRYQCYLSRLTLRTKVMQEFFIKKTHLTWRRKSHQKSGSQPTWRWFSMNGALDHWAAGQTG